ncbi:MAG TPA: D-alanine--D-alanine ligase A [Gammaproteobacteria bacterium]|jgi:D-alanine-D-alanine ligase|nr:D-alanine--D-alanine ligase A [Acidiferrobacteraceae bacterium]MDP6397773.1 D-alanine--D-alanine ligase family protein [Arenicellales bacterium]HCX86647.1 D-alanine--D-alanine ligase A [Gammaproteobacteria bacterium]MDP6552500.1 D-alanine--D-alanine ligase family protein [Arenicellales bacterium]MDP6853864.1 D-alanine--D-alanine ligase family protein [Arenicellales bacterium]|tara:strand:+ start:113 stop:1201 length:1089 start_codon:yes stop_codon:yes gene_type:complete
MSKTRVLLVFGGQSAEHEISVISARSVYAAIDASRYEVVLAGISRSGQWVLEDGERRLLEQDEVIEGSGVPVQLGAGQRDLTALDGTQAGEGRFDVVFPLLHGPHGEDGCVQGLLELADAAYVGAGVAASAVGMDKELARAVFANAGLKQAEYLVVRRSAWNVDRTLIMSRIESALCYPMFVKPVNLGSSIGISKVHNAESLQTALDIAAGYDIKMMIESSVEQARELECAVLGNDDPKASVIGEIIPGAEFYDYTTKYIDDHSQLIVPADLSQSLKASIQEMSLEAFRAIDGAGLARVDFLLPPSGEVFLNEINTMPGFTPISMYPRLWQASGIEYPTLIDQLIQLALDRYREKQQISLSR